MLAVIKLPKFSYREHVPKKDLEEERHPILGPLEKHARGLQEEAHQDLSAEVSVPRDRHARHFQ